MKLTSNNSIEVRYYNVKRETEKAILVSLPVSWNSNYYERQFWFPKSCVEMYKDTMAIATFLVGKMGQEYAYHGYMMYFDEIGQ